MIGKLKINKFIVPIIIFELLVVVFYITDFFIGRPWTKPTILADMDGESSFCCWFSVVQLALVAFLSAVVAYYNSSWEKKLTWLLWGIPVIFVLLSMDENVQIHEWLGQKSDMFLEGGSRLNTPFVRTGIWFLLLGIPFIFLLSAYICFLKKFFKNTYNYRSMIIGFAIFLIGSLGFEGLSNLFPDAQATGSILLVSIEEFLEMLGVTVILNGMLNLCDIRIKVRADDTSV